MPDVEEVVSASPKKRGRPPKEKPAPAEGESGEPVVKRGRGRPKGSTKKKDAPTKPTGPKRPRGRPKGSVKKATAPSPKKSPRKSSDWEIASSIIYYRGYYQKHGHCYSRYNIHVCLLCYVIYLYTYMYVQSYSMHVTRNVFTRASYFCLLQFWNETAVLWFNSLGFNLMLPFYESVCFISWVRSAFF